MDSICKYIYYTFTHTHTLTHTHTSTQTLSFSFLVPFYNDTHSPVFTRTQIHLAALIRLRKRALYIYTPKKPYPTAAAIYDTHTRIRSTKKPCIFTKKTLFIHRGDLWHTHTHLQKLIEQFCFFWYISERPTAWADGDVYWCVLMNTYIDTVTYAAPYVAAGIGRQRHILVCTCRCTHRHRHIHGHSHEHSHIRSCRHRHIQTHSGVYIIDAYIDRGTYIDTVTNTATYIDTVPNTAT